MSRSVLRRVVHAWLAVGVLPILAGCSDAPAEEGRLRSGAPSTTATVQGRVDGTGASGLRVREKPSTTSAQVGTLLEGAVVTIDCQVDGETINGNKVWDHITGDPSGYVADAFIVIASGEQNLPRCDAPVSTTPPPTPNGNATVDIEGPPVQPHVQVFANEACGQVNACRATTREGHDPSADLALDFPTGEAYGKLPTDNHAFGDRLAEFAVTNQAKYRIEYVIYRQRINFGQGWEPMEDRGDITQNHFDHVHVSFDP